MKIICAWCNAVITPGDGETSHGICHACFNAQLSPREQTQAERDYCKALKPHAYAGNLVLHYREGCTLITDDNVHIAYDVPLDADTIASLWKDHNVASP